MFFINNDLKTKYVIYLRKKINNIIKIFAFIIRGRIIILIIINY